MIIVHCLGENAEEFYQPKGCKGCDQLLFIGVRGKAMACCFSPTKFIKITSAWKHFFVPGM